jgi:hypothetical protein
LTEERERRGEAMAARRDDRDDIRIKFVRRLVALRCPEVTLSELKAAFGGDNTYADDPNVVLAEIADAVTDAIEALEGRLSEIERALPWRVH